jgi:uncharacterized protein
MNMDHLYLKASKINGKGLHTAIKIKKDARVGTIQGEIEIVRKWTSALSQKSFNWIGIGRFSWINTNKSPFRYINHSCNPNTYIVGKRIVLALRDIAPNEEVTMDYSFTEADPGWYIDPCSCGSKNCRSHIGPITSLDVTTFKKNISIIPENFKRIFLVDYRKLTTSKK